MYPRIGSVPRFCELYSGTTTRATDVGGYEAEEKWLDLVNYGALEWACMVTCTMSCEQAVTEALDLLGSGTKALDLLGSGGLDLPDSEASFAPLLYWFRTFGIG